MIPEARVTELETLATALRALPGVRAKAHIGLVAEVFGHGDWYAGPGDDGARVLLRFDGVESVYRVWLNGTEVGVGKGSRLVQEFDVTELLVDGENVLVVRVHQWSSMSYVEDQDQWWLPGIFRDVTVLSRPLGAVDDVWLRTEYAPDGTGSIDPEIIAPERAFPLVIEIPELGV